MNLDRRKFIAIGAVSVAGLGGYSYFSENS